MHTGARPGMGQFSSGRMVQSEGQQCQGRKQSGCEQCKGCEASLLGTAAGGSGDSQHPHVVPISDGGKAGRRKWGNCSRVVKCHGLKENGCT